MALREILTDKNPKLRKVCRKVDRIDDRTLTLLDDLAETMYKSDGLGLAAPQVGVLKRIAVVDVGDGLIELINPVVVSGKGEYCDLEGCLSLPGESAYVMRPQEVVVQAIDRHGDLMEYQCDWLCARCMCHEIDHLEGILCTDKGVEPTEEILKEIEKRHTEQLVEEEDMEVEDVESEDVKETAQQL